MYALLVTFTPEAPEEEIMAVLGPHVKRLVETAPGLVMKTYVMESATRWGGFYLFEGKGDAERFLESELFQTLSSTPTTSNVDARHFEVEDAPSQAFGTPTTPLSKAAATRAAS